MKERAKKWLEETVKYFEGIGFLEDGFKLEKLHEYIRDIYFDEYIERPLKPNGWFPLDAQILNQDSKRVWWKDLEISYSTQDTYLKTIQRWSDISRGRFLPHDIQFKQVVTNGEFEITFRVNNKPFSYQSNSTGWIDLLLIDEINTLLVNSDIFLYSCDTEDQTVFLVALTKKEKRKLEKERGWKCYCVHDQAG